MHMIAYFLGAKRATRCRFVAEIDALDDTPVQVWAQKMASESVDEAGNTRILFRASGGPVS